MTTPKIESARIEIRLATGQVRTIELESTDDIPIEGGFSIDTEKIEGPPDGPARTFVAGRSFAHISLKGRIR